MKVKKALFIGVDGTVKRLEEIEGKELSFQNMYSIVGNGCNMIEHVSLRKGIDMWVDEEGLLKENNLNVLATKLYRKAYPHIPPEDLGIVGNAILTDNTKAEEYVKV